MYEFEIPRSKIEVEDKDFAEIAEIAKRAKQTPEELVAEWMLAGVELAIQGHLQMWHDLQNLKKAQKD